MKRKNKIKKYTAAAAVLRLARAQKKNMNDTHKRVVYVCVCVLYGTPVLVVVLGSQVTRARIKAVVRRRRRVARAKKNKTRARIFYTPTGCTTSNTSSISSSWDILEYNK